MKSVEKRTANAFHLLSHNKSQLFSQLVQHFIYGLPVFGAIKNANILSVHSIPRTHNSFISRVNKVVRLFLHCAIQLKPI